MEEKLRAMQPSDYLAQIAEMLTDSEDVPTDADDVSDAVSIVQTVKNALEYLSAVRDDNRSKSEKIAKLKFLLEESRGMNKAAQAEIERLCDKILSCHTDAVEPQDKYNAAKERLQFLEIDKTNADETNDGYSDLFWVMFWAGVIGVIGFCIVAAGGA